MSGVSRGRISTTVLKKESAPVYCTGGTLWWPWKCRLGAVDCFKQGKKKSMAWFHLVSLPCLFPCHTSSIRLTRTRRDYQPDKRQVRGCWKLAGPRLLESSEEWDIFGGWLIPEGYCHVVIWKLIGTVYVDFFLLPRIFLTDGLIF